MDVSPLRIADHVSVPAEWIKTHPTTNRPAVSGFRDLEQGSPKSTAFANVIRPATSQTARPAPYNVSHSCKLMFLASAPPLQPTFKRD